MFEYFVSRWARKKHHFNSLTREKLLWIEAKTTDSLINLFFQFVFCQLIKSEVNMQCTSYVFISSNCSDLVFLSLDNPLILLKFLFFLSFCRNFHWHLIKNQDIVKLTYFEFEKPKIVVSKFIWKCSNLSESGPVAASFTIFQNSRCANDLVAVSMDHYYYSLFIWFENCN